MSAILDKAAAHAAAKKIDSTVLAQARLFPDMHPLSRQVQIACDTAKGAAAPAGGDRSAEARGHGEHIARTQSAHRQDRGFYKDRDRRQVAGDDARAIEMKFPNGSLEIHRARAMSTISCCRIFISTPAWSTHCCARAASKSARGFSRRHQ